MTTEPSPESIREALSLLDRLGVMPDGQLAGHFTNQTIAFLRIVAGELREGMAVEHAISERQFVRLVKELAQANRAWSEKFRAMLDASRRDPARAEWHLNGFMRFCPSPYYRRLAEGELARLRKTASVPQK